jgi:Leucine-rich repeat (LRR) protein
MATFITSKTVGETILINLSTTTGYFKYYHNGSWSGVRDIAPNFENPQEFILQRTLSIQNSNGEFTIVSCDSSGNISGNTTILNLSGRRAKGTQPEIRNQLTSFDGTDLTSLTNLNLGYNQLTSFNGTGLTGLQNLDLSSNLLTSFDGTDLTNLDTLVLLGNDLTSLDVSPMTSLLYLNLTDPYGLNGNPMTPSANNAILSHLINQISEARPGHFFTSGGRTAASTSNYDSLIADGWNLIGLELYTPPTFITSKSIGDSISINVNTSTGYWKYNHNGKDSSVFSNGSQTITVANANGEFTLIPCLSDGTPSGDITQLWLYNNQLTSFDGTGLGSLANLGLSINQLTSFDGTGLSGLTELLLNNNQLTSFDGTGLTSLTQLNLNNNQLTSFDGTGLTSLNSLNLYNNQLTSFDGTGLSSLIELNLNYNQLTSFDGTDLTSLTYLYLNNNQLTSFDGTDLTSLIGLYLRANQLTSFDGTDLTSLTGLNLSANQLTSFDGTGLSSLTQLYLNGNQLTSFDGTGLTSLTYLDLHDNQLTSFDGTGLSSLIELNLNYNQLTSFDGTDLTSLTYLSLEGNQLTSFDPTGLDVLQYLYIDNNPFTNPTSTNNSLLAQLAANELSNGWNSGEFTTTGGRTSAGTSDYDYLIANGWNLQGLDLPTPPPSGNGKLRIKGVNSGGGVKPPVYTTYTFQNRDENGPISNTLVELYSNESVITSGVTDIDGNFIYSFEGQRVEYLYKGYDTSDNTGNVTWWGTTGDRGNGTGGRTTFIRPLPRNLSYDITLSTSNGDPIANQLISYIDGYGKADKPLGIEGNEFTLGYTDANGQISGTISVLRDIFFNGGQYTDANGVPYGISMFGEVLENQNSFTYTNSFSPQFSQWNVTNLPDNSFVTLDQVDENGVFIQSYGNMTNENMSNPSCEFGSLQGNTIYKLSVYNGLDIPPTTEPIYTETWTIVWRQDHDTDLSVTITTTTESPTTTTTTTAPPLWDGGTIYSIGAVVTFEGQIWNCIQYAPAGYGPFGGYIDVYWTL